MTDLLKLILAALASLFKSRAKLEAENLVLRQQINVLRRRMPKGPALTNNDRFLFIWLYRWFPSTVGALAIVRPETIIRWHRVGFRAYWRWRSRNSVGRPKVPAKLRALIGEMSGANPLWGAPRIHGELLKLGFDVAQSTVAKYMVRRRGPPSQSWKTFLLNHAPHITAIDMFVVPTIGFRLLYGLAIIRLERRHLVWINATANPTADWIARQLTEAFPWDQAPRYLIRDRDASYSFAVTRRLAAMGIRDRPTAPRSPWQNGHVELFIGSIRRECLDHVMVLSDAHLRHVLAGMPPIIMISERTDLWPTTPRSIAQSSVSAPSHHARSSAAFTTNIAESNTRYTQPKDHSRAADPGDCTPVPRHCAMRRRKLAGPIHLQIMRDRAAGRRDRRHRWGPEGPFPPG
jgi:transposase InsO family protein